MNHSPRKLLLRDATVVSPDRLIEHGSVLIEDGYISSTDEGRATDAGTIDVGGMTLLPGFIDVHIHGAAGVDVMEATADRLREVSDYLASQGVTAWVPTFVPARDENYASAVRAISQSIENGGARVLGVHYEGPFVNSAQCGALHTEYFKTYSGPHDLDSLPVPNNAVHMITLAPEVAGGVELVRELKARGWVI